MADFVLQVTDICKDFEAVRAVDSLSFSVAPGEIFALLGPNGAGKTTVVRMLLGILRPDKGTISFSLDGSARWPLPAEVGYLPEDRGLYRDIPVERTLIYFAQLRGLSSAAACTAARTWLKRLGLEARARDKLDTLSKGNQQKVQFIAAILHQPRFAVLDEPFSGLDPLNQNLFLDVLRDLRAGGMTILLSAHQMALVEKLADRVLLLNRGRQVLQGTLSELRQAVQAGTRVRFQLGRPVGAAELAEVPGFQDLCWDGTSVVTGQVSDGIPLNDVLRAVADRVPVVAVHTEQLSLHDIYVRALGTSAAGEVNGSEQDWA